MSKFLICECCNQTYLEEDMSKNNKNMCCSCWCYTRPKDKRIAELEEQLKNAIVLPEIKKGQKIYCLREYKLNHLRTGYFQKWNNKVWADVIFDPKEVTDEDGYTYVDFDFDMVDINAVFITKQEAEQRLKELKGE